MSTSYNVTSDDSIWSLMLNRILKKSYVYTASESNSLFSAVAIGAMTAVYPFMYIIQKKGSRSVVTIVGLFSAVTTFLIPWMAYLGFYPLLAMRFLQGMGLSTGFTLIGIVTRQWSMQAQGAFFFACLSCFFQLGPIFTMPVSGALCTSSIGWPAVYYVHSMVTIMIFSSFFNFYRENPISHKFVSQLELSKIQRGKGETKRQPVPLRQILTDPVVLSIWTTALANFMGIQLTMQFSPTYLHKILGFSVKDTGPFSALPQVITAFVKVSAGYSADKLRCCLPKTSVRIFNSIALGGMSFTFLGLAYIPTSEPYLGLWMLVISCAIIGFNCGGFFRCSAIYAAQHNHFVMGMNSFLNCLAALLAPVIVNFYVRNDTWNEWYWVWMSHFVILFASNLVFQYYAKGEPAEWTKPSKEIVYSEDNNDVIIIKF
uniref:MFS domain-containing protein n=1 Tax=Caenorhabditis tropicalis TaxID=1561998 RepID=A0A1I7UCJ2_9PELO